MGTFARTRWGIRYFAEIFYEASWKQQEKTLMFKIALAVIMLTLYSKFSLKIQQKFYSF